MWTIVHDAPSAVCLSFLVGSTIMGLSHVLQPGMWREVFTGLHRQGLRGVVLRTFIFDRWPALLLVTFHQVWSGRAIIVTAFGWLLLLKVAVSLLVPSIGLKSLAMARSDDRRFVFAGFGLLAVAGAAGVSLATGVAL